MPFYDDLLQGYYLKEIVRIVLDKSGYIVFPYGYESAFSYIKIQLHKRDVKDSPAVRKIRSSTDLLVYSPDQKDIALVEVKSRNWDNVKVELSLDTYFKYWSESTVVVIAPAGHWFYAQHVENLNKKKEYDLSQDFETFEEIFDGVETDYLYRFKERIAEHLNRPLNHWYFPEEPAFTKTHNKHLHEFIQDNEGLDFENLLQEYNQINLISSTLLRRNLVALINEDLIEERKGRHYST